jgi:hypothetical protein
MVPLWGLVAFYNHQDGGFPMKRSAVLLTAFAVSACNTQSGPDEDWDLVSGNDDTTSGGIRGGTVKRREYVIPGHSYFKNDGSTVPAVGGESSNGSPIGVGALTADSSAWEPWEPDAFKLTIDWVWSDHEPGNSYKPSDAGPGNHLHVKLNVRGGKTKHWAIPLFFDPGDPRNANFVITTDMGEGDRMERVINYLATLSTTPGVSGSLFDYIGEGTPIRFQNVPILSSTHTCPTNPVTGNPFIPRQFETRTIVPDSGRVCFAEHGVSERAIPEARYVNGYMSSSVCMGALPTVMGGASTGAQRRCSSQTDCSDIAGAKCIWQVSGDPLGYCLQKSECLQVTDTSLRFRTNTGQIVTGGERLNLVCEFAPANSSTGIPETSNRVGRANGETQAFADGMGQGRTELIDGVWQVTQNKCISNNECNCVGAGTAGGCPRDANWVCWSPNEPGTGKDDGWATIRNPDGSLTQRHAGGPKVYPVGHRMNPNGPEPLPNPNVGRCYSSVGRVDATNKIVNPTGPAGAVGIDRRAYAPSLTPAVNPGEGYSTVFTSLLNNRATVQFIRENGVQVGTKFDMCMVD